MSRKSKLIPKSGYRLFVLKALIFIVAVAFSYVAADYINFQKNNHSRFFGSKDVYAQNESLYFDNIKVTVSGVEHMYHPKRTYLECGEKPSDNPYVRFGEEYSKGTIDKCLEDAAAYENRKLIIVHYFIENRTDKPLSLHDYSVYVGGSDGVPFNEPKEKQYDLLANQSRYNAVVLDVDRDVESPLALIVSKDNAKKQIDLELPEVEVNTKSSPDPVGIDKVLKKALENSR